MAEALCQGRLSEVLEVDRARASTRPAHLPVRVRRRAPAPDLQHGPRRTVAAVAARRAQCVPDVALPRLARLTEPGSRAEAMGPRISTGRRSGLVHERVELRFDRDQVWIVHR